MKNIIARFATAADAEMIADISRQTFYETFGFLNTKENMDKFMSKQFNREVLINEVSEPVNTFIVAMDDDKMVGYAKLKRGGSYSEFQNKDAIEISRIYVLNSYLGMGIGQQLMRKCISTAKDLKNEIIWLGVWEHNQRAIDFYTKWGFEKFATHVFMLGTDAQTDWLMKKSLSPF